MKFITGYKKLILIAVPVISAAVVWVLLDSGFCFSRKRYLSDRELIVEAIRYNAGDMKIAGPDEPSAEAFLQQNPRCCSVDRHPATRSLLDVCSGFNISEVTLNYEEKAQKPLLEPFRQADISVSACGEALKRKRAMSYATLQAAH